MFLVLTQSERNLKNGYFKKRERKREREREREREVSVCRRAQPQRHFSYKGRPGITRNTLTHSLLTLIK